MLPERVKVSVESTNDGLWARISAEGSNVLDNCYTQAANSAELVLMVNDAIQTHFEIPEELKSEVGYYTPVSERHLRLEEMFRNLVMMEQEADTRGKSETTLTLKDNELVCN